MKTANVKFILSNMNLFKSDKFKALSKTFTLGCFLGASLYSASSLAEIKILDVGDKVILETTPSDSADQYASSGKNIKVGIGLFPNAGKIGIYNYAIDSKTVTADVEIKSLQICARLYTGTSISLSLDRNSEIIANLTNGSSSSNWKILCGNIDLPKNVKRASIQGRMYSSDIEVGASLWIRQAVLDTFAAPAAENSDFMSGYLTSASNAIIRQYKFSLANLQTLSANLKKSDRRHLTRLKETMEMGLNDLQGKDGNPKLPVTHMKVQENARLVMVLSEVLNLLLADYEDVPAISNSVKSLMSLSASIRGAYGWNEGLSGSASKSLASLAYVIGLEVSDLYSAMSAFGGVNQQNIQPLSNVMRQSSALARSVNANNGGDAQAGQAVANLAQAWNSVEFQKILSDFLTAPADFSNQVQPKLRLLLTAAESLSDFTKTTFNIDGELKQALAKPVIVPTQK